MAIDSNDIHSVQTDDLPFPTQHPITSFFIGHGTHGDQGQLSLQLCRKMSLGVRFFEKDPRMASCMALFVVKLNISRDVPLSRQENFSSADAENHSRPHVHIPGNSMSHPRHASILCSCGSR